jgi:hypothetical protein
MRARTALLIAIACALAPAAPARAAFPGRNGLLAVQPRSGPGIVLVNPDGSGAQRVCSDRQLCGRPQAPRWAPDGSMLAFADGASMLPVIVSADGGCMWCLRGTPLTNDRGTGPAFTRSGTAITHTSSAGRLDETELGGGTTTIPIIGLSDAGWSSTGRLAGDMQGSVWITRAGIRGLHRLAGGSEPSWSPDGRSLAIAQQGSIKIVDAMSGRTRMLARGSAPAFSPDGSQIAFIGPSGRVMLTRAGGGGTRRVGSISGRAVDWQPLRRRVDLCNRLPGDAVTIASDAQAVVYKHTDSEQITGWYGCLRAVGRATLLMSAGDLTRADITVTVRKLQLTGRYALIQTQETDLDKRLCGIALTVTDLGFGRTSPRSGGDCPQADAPVASADQASLDSSGFYAWHLTSTPSVPAGPLTSVSCPSVSFCAASGNGGVVVTSTRPTGGRSAWTVTKLPGAGVAQAVACASPALCVLLDGSSLITSTDPAGGASAWPGGGFLTPGVLFYVACPSTALCVAVDNLGHVLTSTDPAGGATTWSSVMVDATKQFEGLSCASSAFCVADDMFGGVDTSTNPSGGAAAWSAPQPTNANIGELSCPTASLCVAAVTSYTAAQLLVSSNPAGGTAAWSPVQLAGMTGPITAVGCASASVCVAFDSQGRVATSTNPAGGAAAWTQVGSVDPAQPQFGSTPVISVSCPSATMCVAVDRAGNALISTDPAGGAGTWSRTLVDGPDCAAYSPCTSEGLFVHGAGGTRLLDIAPPGAGNSIAGLTLAAESLRVTWTHGGATRAAALR